MKQVDRITAELFPCENNRIVCPTCRRFKVLIDQSNFYLTLGSVTAVGQKGCGHNLEPYPETTAVLNFMLFIVALPKWPLEKRIPAINMGQESGL